MKWLTQSGKEVNAPIHKYSIKYNVSARSQESQPIKDFFRTFCRGHVVLEEFKIPKTRLFVDFINLTLKIAIEHQGSSGHHFTYFPHFHKSRLGFLGQLERDEQKRMLLEKNGFILIETIKEDFPLSKQWFKEKYGITI